MVDCSLANLRKAREPPSELSGLYRQSSPTTRLPVEVFIRIIRAGQSPAGFQKHLTHNDISELYDPIGPRPIEVLASHVCRTWRSAVLGDPSLWTNIDVRYASSYYLLLERIKRSRKHLLNVKIRICEDFTVRSTWFACIKPLCMVSGHWKHLDIVISDLEAMYCIQSEMQILAAPRLESLRIQFCGDPERIPGRKAQDQSPGLILAQGAPVLRTLVLDGSCPVRLDPCILNGIMQRAVTTIRDCKLSAIPWTYGTLHFLASACKQLRELTLGYDTSPFSEPRHMRALFFPALTTLNIVGYTKTMAVLETLVAPKLQTLNCWLPRMGLGNELSDATCGVSLLGDTRFPLLASIKLRYEGRIKAGDTAIAHDMFRLFPLTAVVAGTFEQQWHETALSFFSDQYIWNEYNRYIDPIVLLRDMRQLEQVEIARWEAMILGAALEVLADSALTPRAADEVLYQRIWSSVW